MIFSHIHQAVHHEPWLITSAGHATVAALIDKKIKQRMLKSASETPSTDFFGEPLPAMSIDPITGLAIIPIQGVLARGVGGIEKMCGACDTNDVIANIQEAEASSLVRAILFSINSPGGAYAGTPELGEAIAAMTKPNASWIVAQCCSGAYWAASQTGQIFAPTSGEAGSIGVLSAFRDKSMQREIGLEPVIKVNRASTAPLKAPSAHSTPVTADQQAQEDAQLDWIHQQFMAAILANRLEVPMASMRGQTFIGQQAVEAGLVDEICTLDYAIASLL